MSVSSHKEEALIDEKVSFIREIRRELIPLARTLMTVLIKKIQKDTV